MSHPTLQWAQDECEHLNVDRVATVYAGDDVDVAKYIRATLEEGLQRERAKMIRYGPLKIRRFLTAEEYENGEGDESSLIQGSELRKILTKRGMKDDIR